MEKLLPLRLGKSVIERADDKPSPKIHITLLYTKSKSSLRRMKTPTDGIAGGRSRQPLRAAERTSRSSSVVIYRLICDHPLPTVDTCRSIKTMILGGDANSTSQSQYGWIMNCAMHIGNGVMIIALLAPQPSSRIAAAVAPLLQLPGTIGALAAIRVQMLRVLLGTYDFWFFTLSNFVVCGCFIKLLGDLRVISVLLGSLLVQTSICADAQVGNPRDLFVTSSTNALTQIILFVAVELHAVNEAVDYSASTNVNFTVHDLLANTLLNVVVLFGRLVYRNFRIMHDKSRTGRRISSTHVLVPINRMCASYHCVIKLSSVVLGDAAITRARNPRTPLESEGGVAQLEFVPVPEIFDARDVIVPSLGMRLFSFDRMSSHSRFHTITCILLNIMAPVGFACTIFSDPMGMLHPVLPAKLLQIIGAVCSVVFCSVFIALYQRQLLCRLAGSFDFLFLTSNNTVVTIGMSCLLKWDYGRVMVVWVFWLWMLWALTLDALTPTAANSLHFRRRYAVPIIAFTFLIQIVTIVDFFFLHHIPVPHSSIVSATIGGRQVEIKAAPFFITRVWSVLLWSGRLLWRALSRKSDDERLMMQGQVEYRFQWKKYEDKYGRRKKSIYRLVRASIVALKLQKRVQPRGDEEKQSDFTRADIKAIHSPVG